MNEWTVIRAMLEDLNDSAVTRWEKIAQVWAESRREGKAKLGKRLSRSVGREIRLRGGT